MKKLAMTSHPVNSNVAKSLGSNTNNTVSSYCSSDSNATDCKQQQQQQQAISNSDPPNLNDNVETETESGTESGNETETETEDHSLSQPLAQTNNKPAPLIDSDFSQVAPADSTTSNCSPNSSSFISISIPTSISTSTSTSTSISASTFAIEPTITRLVQTTTHSDDARLVEIAQRPVKETASNTSTQSSLLLSYSPASNFSSSSSSASNSGIESTVHFERQQSETQIQPSFLESGDQIYLGGREGLTSVRFPNDFQSVLQVGEGKQDAKLPSAIIEKMSTDSAIPITYSSSNERSPIEDPHHQLER